jgi:hypothetical protein
MEPRLGMWRSCLVHWTLDRDEPGTSMSTLHNMI